MALISPSILAADFVNLERDIRNIGENGGDWVHVDVMDGVFVPNITIGIPVVRAIRKVTELPLDVHLMIVEPIRYIEKFAKAGADWITIHLESDTPENIRKSLELIRSLGCKPGISLKPGTSAQEAAPYLDICDMILVMTVEPGFGGQSFMPDMMEKLVQLKKMLRSVNPSCHLQVDGGVDSSTCVLCKQAGADVLVTGSAYFKAEDRSAFVKQIKA